LQNFDSILKILLFANTDWYLYNFRLTLALALRDAGHEVVLLSPAGIYSETFQDRGLRWLPAPMDRRSLNPFSELTFIHWLYRTILQERFDLVHGFTIKGVVYGAIAARLARVSSRVSSIDGLGYVFSSSDFKAKCLSPLVRTLLRFSLKGESARLILQNQDDVALFKNNGLIDAARIRMISGAGVDCNRFAVGGKRVEGEPLRVLLAARLLWDKGIAEYVAAARMLKAQGLKVHMLLAGMPDLGNPDTVKPAIAQGWIEEGLIDWLGHVADMAGLLATVHLVVLPTAYREGLPTALTEGASCGLPLITTDMPGCREVVTHEIDGLIIPIRDPDALAQAIIRIYDDPELATKLGAAARAKALKQFDEKIVIEQTIGVYSELKTFKPRTP
jgi:glycosyltransferase involved in cell wall biosynthesis